MPRHAPVGVDDDLPPRDARVTHRAADHELARGVHEDPGSGPVVPMFVQHGKDDLADDLRGHHVRQGDAIVVLRGNHDGLDADGFSFLVADRDLGLAVGTQVVEQPLLTDIGQAGREPVGQVDGQGHQLLGLVTGVTEHQALVTGPLAAGGVPVLVVANLQGIVHTTGDVR